MTRLPLILSLATTFALLATADPRDDAHAASMLGATDMPGWTNLPEGQDIALRSETTYSALASISKDFSKADILKKVPNGVEVLNFLENPPDFGPDPNPDHRYVSGKFLVHRDGETLPWKSPWPTTIFHLVGASSTRGSGQAQPFPTAPPRHVWRWVVGGLLGALAFGGLGWRWLHRARVAR